MLRDLAYVAHGHPRQTLDLYLPQTGTRWPLIIWMHGGAWLAGNKDDVRPATFLSRGFAVASLNYRLSLHAIFPAQIEDGKAAVRWLRSQASTYRYDPTRIGAIGVSAGGHLAAMLGSTGGIKDFDTGDHLDMSSRVQAVADLFGPTDFLQMDAHNLPNAALVHAAADSPESRLVGGPIAEHRDRVRRANPITYISMDSPPFLIVHGDADLLVPHRQSELLAAALTQAGVRATLHTIRGGVHGGPTLDAGLPLAIEFFARILNPDML